MGSIIFLIVRMLDPITAAMAIAGGLFSRSWLHVALTAVVVGAIGEILLFVSQYARTFNPLTLLMGIVAAGAWAAIAFAIKKWWRGRTRPNPPGNQS